MGLIEIGFIFGTDLITGFIPVVSWCLSMAIGLSLGFTALIDFAFDPYITGIGLSDSL